MSENTAGPDHTAPGTEPNPPLTKPADPETATVVTGEVPPAPPLPGAATDPRHVPEPEFLAASDEVVDPVTVEPETIEPEIVAEPVIVEPVFVEPEIIEPEAVADARVSPPLPEPASDIPLRHSGPVPDPAPQPDRSLAGMARPEPLVESLAESAPTIIVPEQVPAPVYVPTPVPPHESLPEYPVTAPAVFVEAPEEPKPGGNRFAGILIGVLSTIIFAGALFGANYGYRLLIGEPSEPLPLISGAWFWMAVAMFFLGSALLAAIINRGGWWAHVLGGIFIGLFAAAGAAGGMLLADAYTIFPEELGTAIIERVFSVPTLIAFILGREVPVWFGLWIAARGRRMTQRHAREYLEYERLIDGGPTLAG